MAVVPWPEQMACRKAIDENRGLKGKREGGFRLSAVVAAKRKTCLVVPLFPKTVAQYSSSSRSRRQTCVSLGLCVGTPLSLSYLQPCSA